MLYDIIRRGADEYPDRPAILFRGGSIGYGDLACSVNRIARGLGALGIQRGDRIALLLPNCPEFTYAYFASAASGAICVPSNPLLKPPELEYIWTDCGARVVITIPQLLPNVLEAKKSVPSLKSVIVAGESAQPADGTVSLAEISALGDPRGCEVSDGDETEVAVCIYTSGTTGRPKGALLSHRNLLSNCRQITGALRFTAEDNVVCVLPLFHSFAATVCQNTVLYCGARYTLLEQFHPVRTMEAIKSHGVTILPAVPAMFAALLQYAGERGDLSSVRVCVSGGAPMPQAVMAAFEEKFGTLIIEGDGPTECSPVTSVNPLDGVRKPGSIGVPIPGVEMKIFDEEDRELLPNEVGEIVVRGDNVMVGYLNQPEATAEAMKKGWYHTGDLGKKDDDGYFYIVDRKKDMLIVGGINVYPREVEDVLRDHPAVADAAVVGCTDRLKGEEVVALVIKKRDAQVTEWDLIRHCRPRLANFKVPKRVIFRESLPYSNTGKVLKRLLRKEVDLGG